MTRRRRARAAEAEELPLFAMAAARVAAAETDRPPAGDDQADDELPPEVALAELRRMFAELGRRMRLPTRREPDR